MGGVVKSIEEINRRIAAGEAVVVNAEEMIAIVGEKGPVKAAEEVDVVTTGTFAPMCSSGALFNLGHPSPKIKIEQAWLNGVPAYGGLAAVDIYLGATALPADDPRNKVYPGTFRYGGGHVIEDFVAGKEISLKATGYGTDCYPRRELETVITKETVNEAMLLNPRNCYQNYACAVNGSDRLIYTYMGMLKPELGNATYCSAGQLSPLLNDPYYRTIGVGTRIFLGGGIGHVISHGTQHNPCAPRGPNGVVTAPAGTLAVMGDLKQMSPKWLRGVSMVGYGASLAVGIGIPIPIIDEEMARFTGVKDSEIYTEVIDYGLHYATGGGEPLARVSYAELRSGTITIRGKKVPTAPISSYSKALEIANILKEWILSGKFTLSTPVASLPGPESGYSPKGMKA